MHIIKCKHCNIGTSKFSEPLQPEEKEIEPVQFLSTVIDFLKSDYSYALYMEYANEQDEQGIAVLEFLNKKPVRLEVFRPESQILQYMEEIVNLISYNIEPLQDVFTNMLHTEQPVKFSKLGLSSNQLRVRNNCDCVIQPGYVYCLEYNNNGVQTGFTTDERVVSHLYRYYSIRNLCIYTKQYGVIAEFLYEPPFHKFKLTEWGIMLYSRRWAKWYTQLNAKV